MSRSRVERALLYACLATVLAGAGRGAPAQERAAAYKFGEFEFTDLDGAQPHADRFVAELKRAERARAVLIGYSPRVSYYEKRYNPGMAAASQVRFLMVSRRDGGIDPARVRLVDGGHRDAETVELFVVPPGAVPPPPTPSHPPGAAVLCTRLRVDPPGQVWEASAPLIFRATLGDVPPGVRPTLSWSVSAGRILRGQGTTSVAVEQPGPGYLPITATVSVGGFSAECATRVSATSPWLTRMPAKFDEFGAIPCGDELARLDNFAGALLLESRLLAYLVVSGGQRGKVVEARHRALRMKSYLVYGRGLAYERVVAVDAGGGGELNVGLWFVPRGTPPPVAAATLRAGEVRMPRGRRRPHHCQDIYDSI